MQRLEGHVARRRVVGEQELKQLQLLQREVAAGLGTRLELARGVVARKRTVERLELLRLLLGDAPPQMHALLVHVGALAVEVAELVQLAIDLHGTAHLARLAAVRAAELRWHVRAVLGFARA